MAIKTVLENGLRVITETMPHTRSASICIFVGVGSRYETDAQAGISHFVEHVLFRGTAKRATSADISGAIEGVGGVLNGATDHESTVYWCKVPQAHFEMGLDVLCDMMRGSLFRTDDIEKERTVIIEEINMSYDAPSQRVGLLIDELLWSGQPLGRDIAGSKATVSGIKRRDLKDYLEARYRPSRVVVSIAGNVPHKAALAAVTAKLGSWANPGERPGFSAFQEMPGERLGVDQRDIEQTHFCLALPGLSNKDPRRFTLDLMNVILGEGMSCRLFTHVRDQLGLAYSVHSYVEHLSDTGSFVIYAGVDTSKMMPALEAVREELERLRDERVPAAELNKARELSKGHLLLRLEDSRSVAGWNGGQEVLTNRVLTPDQVVAELDKITPKNIQAVAREIIQPKLFRLAVVGPVKKNKALRTFVGE